MKIELPYDDCCEVQVVLSYVRDLLVEASAGSLLVDGQFSAKELARRSALRDCNDVLSSEGKLADRFRVVLLSVLDGRSVADLTNQDCGKIASRYDEWLTSPLSSGWRTLAYNSRHDLFQRKRYF